MNNGEEPRPVDFSVDKELFGEVVEIMATQGLIENETVSRGGIGGKVQFVHLKHTKVTLPGLDYLKNNKQ